MGGGHIFSIGPRRPMLMNCCSGSGAPHCGPTHGSVPRCSVGLPVWEAVIPGEGSGDIILPPPPASWLQPTGRAQEGRASTRRKSEHKSEGRAQEGRGKPAYPGLRYNERPTRRQHGQKIDSRGGKTRVLHKAKSADARR